MARLLLPTLLLLAALCVPPTAFAQEGPPPPPHAFFGEVTVNGQPVPVGASVEGRGEGIRTGLPGNPITISEPGRYGGPSVREPKLVAQGWVAEGLALTFYVDGVRAECALPGGAWGESFPFQPGGVTPLNLRVGSAPAAPSSPTDPAAEQQAPPSASTPEATQSPTRPATEIAQAPPSAPVPAMPEATSLPMETIVSTGQAAVSSPTSAAPPPEPEVQPPAQGPEQPEASTAAELSAAAAAQETVTPPARQVKAGAPRGTPTPLLQARSATSAAATPVASSQGEGPDVPILPALAAASLVGALAIGLAGWTLRATRGV